MQLHFFLNSTDISYTWRAKDLVWYIFEIAFSFIFAWNQLMFPTSWRLTWVSLILFDTFIRAIAFLPAINWDFLQVEFKGFCLILMPLALLQCHIFKSLSKCFQKVFRTFSKVLSVSVQHVWSLFSCCTIIPSTHNVHFIWCKIKGKAKLW